MAKWDESAYRRSIERFRLREINTKEAGCKRLLKEREEHTLELRKKGIFFPDKRDPGFPGGDGIPEIWLRTLEIPHQQTIRSEPSYREVGDRAAAEARFRSVDTMMYHFATSPYQHVTRKWDWDGPFDLKHLAWGYRVPPTD